MKAEHRKELQTNTLADNLGRMIQGGRHMNRRTLFIVVAIALVVGGFVIWRMIQNNNVTAQAMSVLLLDQGNLQEIKQEVIDGNPDSQAAKLGRFQLAWFLLWKRGIEPLAASPKQAQQGLLGAQQMYEELAQMSEGDLVLLSEARYALALIEESLAGTESEALSRKDRLTKAISQYRQVAQEFDTTAHGKQAKTRVDYLESNRAQVEAFYDQLGSRAPFDIQDLLRQLNQKKVQEQKDQREKK